MNGALLDTSFLITLTSAQRDDHAVAVQYFRTLIGAGVPIYLSTIVVAEFEVRQRVSDLGMNNFIVVPFNVDHAMAAATLTDRAQAERQQPQTRASVKDDVKLIGQCELGGITHVLTADRPFCSWLDRMRRAHSTRALPFCVYIGDGFKGDWLDPGNQAGLGL